MTFRRFVFIGLVGSIVGLLIAGFLASRFTLAWLHDPIPTLTEPVAYEIPRGVSLAAVAGDLAQRGLIEHPRLLTLWARFTQQAQGVKAGEYELLPGSSPQALLDLFNSGRVLLHSITFIEGTTFADIRKLLAGNPEIRQELAGTSEAMLMERLGAAGTHPEGQFFPDTYRFPRQTSDFELLQMAYQRMQRELAAAWEARAPDLPLESAYEALILASIIEKETALDRERAQISGVFIERLRRRMRLQTDPTVIYGLDDSYDGNLRRADLQRDTPYNTYTRAGLPPTPIALPGRGSLQAAVHPEETGAIFFVATGQGDGSHYFSRTLAEHEAAVQRYLARLRQQQP